MFIIAFLLPPSGSLGSSNLLDWRVSFVSYFDKILNMASIQSHKVREACLKYLQLHLSYLFPILIWLVSHLCPGPSQFCSHLLLAMNLSKIGTSLRVISPPLILWLIVGWNTSSCFYSFKHRLLLLILRGKGGFRI